MNYSKNHNPIINIYGRGKPAVALIGCLHGNEIVGKKVIDNIAKEKIIKGTLITVIGSPLAVEKNKRFIEKDLNRCFPGKKNGIMEERNAYLIMQAIRKADYVIDMHSTTTQGPDFAIIVNNSKMINKLSKIIGFKELVVAPKGIIDTTVINFCNGVTFEFNKSKYKKSVKKPISDIKRCLAALGLIRGNTIKKPRNPEQYKIYDSEKRPKGFIMSDKIKNFHLVKKGSMLGKVGGREILAKEDFYPVLFGKKSYKDIMGFKAVKID